MTSLLEWARKLVTRGSDTGARLEGLGAATEAARRGLAVETAWETLRLRPPTWVTARTTAREVALEHGTVPAHAVVLVSPLLLGRGPDLLPTGSADPSLFGPERWEGADVRPGHRPGAGTRWRGQSRPGHRGVSPTTTARRGPLHEAPGGAVRGG